MEKVTSVLECMQQKHDGMMAVLQAASDSSDSTSASGTDTDSLSSVSELMPDIPLPPPSKAPTETLSIDRDTPDSHVPRDPRLIRLTGVHPFNVEPPLTALFKEGG